MSPGDPPLNEEPTPRGRLRAYLIGDLGPAMRHLQRIRDGTLPPTAGIIEEIRRSVEACVHRIAHDVPADL